MQAKEGHKGLSKAVELTEITTGHFYNENLQFVLAKTHIILNNMDRTREILNELIEKDLLKDPATELLNEAKNLSSIEKNVSKCVIPEFSGLKP